MRTHQTRRSSEFTARMSPTEFGVREIALIAVGRTKMLANFCHAVEFVLRHVLRGPVASVIGEIELLGCRMPVKADGVANTTRDPLGATAVEIHPSDLTMGVVVQHVVAGLSDRDIQLVVGA